MSAPAVSSSPTAMNQGPAARPANRGRKHRGGRRPRKQHPEAKDTKADTAPPTVAVDEEATLVPPEPEDSPVCWICAEPIKFYSVSECNHRTCHVCALRLRALYKRMDCTFCKHSQTTLIFTQSPDEPFEAFTPERIPFKDPKLGIQFETQEMMEETLILLRFSCPDSSCGFIASGWGDLKMHVRAIHSRSMCDLCIRFKKVFSHEHVLYLPSQLPLHLPSISRRASHKSQAHEGMEGGVHPMCNFCRECFFGDDELFSHMRERHEECFICKRAGIRDQHFFDYASLERHFNDVHYPCNDVACQAQKFVVFGSSLDLKAHIVEQHGGQMSSRDKKEARRVEAVFDHDDGDRGGRSDGWRHGRNRTNLREREPPDAGPPWNRRREFGARLTRESSSNVPPPPQEDEQDTIDEDPVTAERHAAFLARVNDLTFNSTVAVSAIKSALRSYRSSESGPRDLITTFFNVVDRDLDATARLISALVELLDEEKRRALLASWNGFKIEQQQQFPDLAPGAPGTEYASVTAGRVLNAKQSASVHSSRRVWDRVAQAAASLSTASPASTTPAVPAPKIGPQDRFPTLASSSSSRKAPAVRQTQHTTAWSTAGGGTLTGSPPSFIPSPPPPPPPLPRHAPAGVIPPRHSLPPSISALIFPTLPTSGGSTLHSRPVVSGNQSLKHILGETAASSQQNVWGRKGDGPDHEEGGAASGNQRKKKGKEKQTLFTLGTFPT